MALAPSTTDSAVLVLCSEKLSPYAAAALMSQWGKNDISSAGWIEGYGNG